MTNHENDKDKESTVTVLDQIKHVDEQVSLWFKYNQVYFKIQKNPRARSAMQDDPGVKYMERGWNIVLIIILLIGAVGVFAKY